MATLITVGHSSGEQRRCDAKCYNATSPECDCVCGGTNHGIGLKAATANTEAIAKNLLKEYKEKYPDRKIEIVDVQQELFNL